MIYLLCDIKHTNDPCAKTIVQIGAIDATANCTRGAVIKTFV
jgi:hypothetical protein